MISEQKFEDNFHKIASQQRDWTNSNRQFGYNNRTRGKPGRLRYFSPSVEKYIGLKNEKEEVIYVKKCTLTTKLTL